MSKIGIYIGAFDPVHTGHLEFANEAVAQNKLDHLYFLVEPKPKYNQGVKAYNHRVNMVMLGVDNDSKLGTIILKTKAGIDEYLPIIQNRFKSEEIYLVVPQESLTNFIKWPYLISNGATKLNVAIGISHGNAVDVIAKLELLSQTSGVKFTYSFFSYGCEPINLKSILVRRSLRKGNKPAEIPGPVYNYISKQNLYFSASSA